MNEKTMTLVETIIGNLCDRRGFDSAFDVGDDILQEIKQEMADAITRNLSQPAERAMVPKGWKLVPIRPDMKMSRAAYAAWERVVPMGALRPNDTTMPFVVWDAMLSAAPEAKP